MSFGLAASDARAQATGPSADKQRPAVPESSARHAVAPPPGAAVYFIDLQDGAVIKTSSVVHFGLKNMGVAPAGLERPKTGHHHLLVDADVPPSTKPIPNDANHLHFGAGQTETTLELLPGEHTLQLELADKDHFAFDPPVLSPRIKVTVVDADAPASKVRHPSPAGAHVYIVSPRPNAIVLKTFRVRFGLEGMGVAPAGFDKANTGHHHLLIDTPIPPLDKPIPNDQNHLHFGAGQTEANVTLPVGVHTLQLLLADANHIPHDPVVISDKIRVTVVSSLRKSRRKSSRR